MGSSGGGGTQRVIQDLPSWSKPYWEGIAATGKGIANQRYSRYPGQRVAGFSPMELQAFGGVQSLYDQGARPELAQSRGIASQASRIGFDTPTFPAMSQQYMNPYLENVLDLGRERMMEDYQGALSESRRNASDAAIAAGTVGGRGTLMGAREAGAISDEAFRAMREFEADTRFRAFDQAQQAFAQDVQNRQSGARLGLDASAQLQNLANMQQTQALERINALQQAGVRGREMEQAIRDQAYQDFVERRDWKRNQLNYFASLLSGTPYATAMNQATRTPGPSAGQIAGGLGIAGIGALGSYLGS